MQQGEIAIRDRALHRLNTRARLDYRRSLGFIFQHHNLFPALTAYESVQMAADLHPWRADEKHRRVVAILERVGLSARMAQKPDQLSGGERQRVAIARALVHDPWLILADEPIAALDAATAASVVALFEALVAERGATILMVSHDSRLFEHATRVLTLIDGRIAADRGSRSPQ